MPRELGKWFRFYDAVLDDPKVQRLSARAFRRELENALRGEPSAFGLHVQAIDDGRPSASEWAVTRARVFERDNYTCQYCDDRGVKLECDHVVPVSRGGTNDDGNLKTACKPCNRSKRAKTLAEWQRVA